MEQLKVFNLADLVPDPQQPRKDFNGERLQELASSIAAVGVIQPIRVRRNPNAEAGDPPYMIIAGERRWQASALANKDTVPGVLVDDDESLSDDVIYAHQLTENLHREQLNPVEKAEFINGRIEYLKSAGVSNAIEQAAKELGVSPSWVSKNTAILKYEPEVRALARDGQIRDYSLLKKISGLKPEKRQQAIALIRTGEFKAKEFFARKRYDKVKDDASSDAKDEAPKAAKRDNIQIQMSCSDWVKLIDKTGYSSLLDRHDQDWRVASSNILKSYVSKFKQWAVETDPE